MRLQTISSLHFCIRVRLKNRFWTFSTQHKPHLRAFDLQDFSIGTCHHSMVCDRRLSYPSQDGSYNVAGHLPGTDRLAKRYACALFELADSAKSHDAVQKDMECLLVAVQDSEAFRVLLKSPVIERSKKVAAMRAISEYFHFTDLIKKLMGLMASKARLAILPAVARAYLAELADRRGEVSASATSATPLSVSQRKALTEALGNVYGTKINLDLKVDKSLLGGLIVQVGSKMVDNSIKAQLAKIELAMKGTA